MINDTSPFKKSDAWLVDSSIYVFKAWYTQPEYLDVEGNPINAVVGFLDFVYQLLSVEKPRLIGFAFDESLGTSYRKDIYPEYKANRAKAPESLRFQFGLCREFISALGIHQDASPYYEADDLIGTWAHSLRLEGARMYFITADKDLAQLVHRDDYWWEYLRGEKLDTRKITKRFGAKPRQIADQLAIAGDKSDNIQGVPGVGMSTAGKLLRKFDNLENLLFNTDDIASMQVRGAVRLQQLIQDNEEDIRLARKLTEIVCDIEQVNTQQFMVKKNDQSHLNKLCNQLNLSQTVKTKWLKLQSQLVMR